jgi:hypothetical protein
MQRLVTPSLRVGLIGFLCCLSPLLANPSDAATIRIDFTGSVDIISTTDPALTTTFNTSQTMSGFYTFESDAGDTNSDPNYGIYAANSFSISVGSYTAFGTDNSLHIVNAESPSSDTYTTFGESLVGPMVGSLSPLVVQMSLFDFFRTALSSDDLVAPVFSSFNTAYWVFHFETTGGGGYLHGTVTSVTATSVPDATSTFGLLSLVLAGLVAAARLRWPVPVLEAAPLAPYMENGPHHSGPFRKSN